MYELNYAKLKKLYTHCMVVGYINLLILASVAIHMGGVSTEAHSIFSYVLFGLMPILSFCAFRANKSRLVVIQPSDVMRSSTRKKLLIAFFFFGITIFFLAYAQAYYELISNGLLYVGSANSFMSISQIFIIIFLVAILDLGKKNAI